MDDTRFVERGEGGRIAAHFATPQPGRDLEALPLGAVLAELAAPPVDAAALAARRWAVETGGTLWEGWPVHTDRDSQAKLGNAYSLARDGHWPEGAGWKFADGEYRPLTAEQVASLALHVASFVAACFAVEAQKAAELAAGGAPDLDSGWPG